MEKRLFFLSAFMLLTSLGYAQFSGSGSGTENDPYLIYDGWELYDVFNDLSAHYKLMADIDMAVFLAEIEMEDEGWEPIGTAANPFTGTFDGNGKTISGLFINRPAMDYVGLFGYVNAATIKNITLRNCSIVAKSNVGTLLGYSSGDITLNNVKVYNTSVESKKGGNAGGIAGDCEGTASIISDLELYNGNVSTASGNQIGGMFGSINSLNSTITNLSGRDLQVTASLTNGESIGGLVGYLKAQCISNVNIINVKVAGKNHIGGLVGMNLTSVEETNICNPIILGDIGAGGIIGSWELNNREGNYIKKCNVLGGLIKGSGEIDIKNLKYFGGIVGGIRYGSYLITNSVNYITKFNIEKNYSSSDIIGGLIGGICGGFNFLIKATDGTICDNRFDGRIICENSTYPLVGGVFGVIGESKPIIRRNIATGSIYGFGNYMGGICPKSYQGVQCSLEYNGCLLDTLSCADGTPLRIGQAGTDNFASNKTVVIANGEEIDGSGSSTDANGVSKAEALLKRKATYTNYGYDFDNTWAIVEGETLPYNINQSTPPTISSCVCGVNAKISGTASGNGTVYVFVNDKMIEGSVVNGKWQVDLGDVAEGTKVRVSVETEGKKPSIVISTKAEYTGVDVVLDENSTEVPASASNVDVQVLRTIKADEWSTICLPFTATGEQVKQAWGEDVQLASFTGWESEEDADGAIVTINVMFSSVNPADGIPANTPMLIKVSEAAETATFDGVTIEPEDEPVVQVGRKASERGWFYGTYKKTIVPEENMFLSGNKFWYSTGKTAIKGYRGYFEFRDVLDAYYDGSEVKVYMFIVEDATGISKSFPSGEDLGEAYNLAGQRVADNYRGIVIENGKKILK